MKPSPGFAVAFWFGQSMEEGRLKLCADDDCLPLSCPKHHDCLQKPALINLDTVRLGGKKIKGGISYGLLCPFFNFSNIEHGVFVFFFFFE